MTGWSRAQERSFVGYGSRESYRRDCKAEGARDGVRRGRVDCAAAVVVPANGVLCCAGEGPGRWLGRRAMVLPDGGWPAVLVIPGEFHDSIQDRLTSLAADSRDSVPCSVPVEEKFRIA